MRAEPQAPLVVDIKRSSLDDGPGIRTVVFFKGCPLRCVWCQNPETLTTGREVQRRPEACIACGDCTAACPHGAARPAVAEEARQFCDLCGACVQACPTAARRVAGQRFDVEALAEECERDLAFYRRSGGGVTLSGGEPALYPAYVGALAARLRQRDIHVLLETSGHFAWADFAAHLLPHVSSIYFDLKLADADAHRRHAGQGTRLIHENLRRLMDAGFDDLLPRVPLIPGITDSEENLSAIGELLTGLGVRRVALLPYNPLWMSKRRALGLEMAYSRETFMTPTAVGACSEVLRSAGLKIVK